jgi:hypothetical protein
MSGKRTAAAPRGGGSSGLNDWQKEHAQSSEAMVSPLT